MSAPALPRHTCSPDDAIQRIYYFCRVRDRAGASSGPAGLRGPHSGEAWARRTGTDKSLEQLVDGILDALGLLAGDCAGCTAEGLEG